MARAKARSGVRVGHARDAGEVVRFAAHELAAGLGAMLQMLRGSRPLTASTRGASS